MRQLVCAAAAAAGLIFATIAHAAAPDDRAAAADEKKRLGSLYLRCDGSPNNMSDGESFARFLGAVTLLAIFAPAPEQPDPKKRLFGAAGVQACSDLLDGKDGESNGLRRMPLILARAIHHIEAKEYQAAIADVGKARGEAEALHLAGNPYFDSSMGLSFNRIEAAARLRMGDAEGARTVALRDIDKHKFDLLALASSSQSFGVFLPQMSPDEEHFLQLLGRVFPGGLQVYANRLDEVGRFADSAKVRGDMQSFTDSLVPKQKNSIWRARTALSHALAGDHDSAASLADAARANLQARRDGGKPEDDASKVVEVLDLVTVVQLANEGKIAEARRNFASRSQWLEPSFGAVLEVNRRLRQGAGQAELFGALADTPEKLWQDRQDALRARMQETDKDNSTLFSSIVRYAKVDDYELASKAVWNTAKSTMMLKKQGENGYWTLYSGTMPLVSWDAIILHAALQAKAQGKQGFAIAVSPQRPMIALARFGNAGDPDMPRSLYIDAGEAIANLRQAIPTPEEVKARRKAVRS
jgi:hypothetical protein